MPAAAAAFLRAWRAWPATAAALDGLDACGAEDVAAALAVIDALFADDGWTAATVTALAAAARADPGFAPPFATLGDGVQEGLLLIDHPRATTGLGVVPHAVLGGRKSGGRGAGSIGFAGTIARYRVVRGGAARLGWWACDPIDGEFDAAVARPCRRTGTRRLADGDWLLVDGRREGFIVEHATADLLLLKATLAVGRAPLQTEHDAGTHAFAAASATDPAASHRQMMATLLRAMGRADAAPALAAMAGDRDFFVRWHAARELAALDPSAALPVLERLTRDPRPDIAAAATAAMDGRRFERPRPSPPPRPRAIAASDARTGTAIALAEPTAPPAAASPPGARHGGYPIWRA